MNDPTEGIMSNKNRKILFILFELLYREANLVFPDIKYNKNVSIIKVF